MSACVGVCVHVVPVVMWNQLDVRVFILFAITIPNMVKHVMLYISMYGEVTLTVVIGYVVITPVDELNIVRLNFVYYTKDWGGS